MSQKFEILVSGEETAASLTQSQAAGILCTQASLNLHVLGGSVGVDYC